MKKFSNVAAIILIFGLVAAGQGNCAEPAKAVETVVPPASQPAPAKKETAAAAVKEAKEPEKPLVAGKVLETMNAGGYTYMLLEKDGRKGWVAVPNMKVKVGQEVQLNPGMEMGKFTSKSLNRTFDQIVFTNAPATGETQQMPQGHPKTGETAAKPAGHTAMTGQGGTEEAAALTGKVVETMDGGGYTYINLEKDGKKTWVAVPVMKVKVGDQVKLQNGMPMTNFKSKALNRTFESVIFSGGPVSGN
ncbi:MAG TPA: hypothetical protein VI298_02940 [Geobacteraceae bacterium]